MGVFRPLGLLLLMSGFVLGQAQVVCTPANQARLEKELAYLASQSWEGYTPGALMTHMGKRWLGVPYVAKTLEVGGEEEPLVINVQELDCTTFMENMVVMARLAHQGTFTIEAFQAALTQLRYRDGVRQGYPSRLHYTSDWLANNAAKGIIDIRTLELGGIALPGPTNFMSTHRGSYAQLANEQDYRSIQQVEQALNRQAHLYLPKAKLAAQTAKLAEGDIVAFTTTIKGLDVVHVGLVTFVNGQAHLMHASTGSNQVEVSKQSLVDYVMSKRHMSGVMIARVKG